MPTVDDLRAALAERESHSGDPDTMLRGLDERLRHTRLTAQRLRVIGVVASAGLVAASVIALVAFTVILPTGPNRAASGGGHRNEIPSPSSQTSVSAGHRTTSPTHSPPMRSPSTHVPTTTLTLDAIPGYTVAYGTDASGQPTAEVTSAQDPAVTAEVTVHAKGRFNPYRDGRVIDAGAHAGGGNGKEVWVYVGDASSLTLYWTYADNAWAGVAVRGVPGLATPVGHVPTAAQEDALRIATTVAHAVHVNGGPSLIPAP